jgi:hypothetical protein
MHLPQMEKNINYLAFHIFFPPKLNIIFPGLDKLVWAEIPMINPWLLATSGSTLNGIMLERYN